MRMTELVRDHIDLLGYEARGQTNVVVLAQEKLLCHPREHLRPGTPLFLHVAHHCGVVRAKQDVAVCRM